MATTEWTEFRCPRCRSLLLSNDVSLWCSYVCCSYGLDERVFVGKAHATDQDQSQDQKRQASRSE